MAERSVNKAILVGRLGGDAETRYTQGGTPVSRFSLAMNRQWRDSERQVHEETDWLYVVLWRNENLAAYLTKGAKLYVEGRIQTRSYDDNEGAIRHRSSSRQHRVARRKRERAPERGEPGREIAKQSRAEQASKRSRRS